MESAKMAEHGTVEWHPAGLLQEGGPVSPFALLLLNQPLRDVPTLARLWAKCM